MNQSASSVDDTRDRVKVLYILGTQRGGTTIAGRLIGQLPGFEFVGELRRIYEVGLAEGRRCGCGATYDTCRVWSDVLPRVLRGVEPTEVQQWQTAAVPRHLSSLGALGGRTPSQSACSYRSIMADTYRALGDVTGARVIVDSSKLPAEAALLAGSESIDLFLLQVVRDPRGTVHSHIRRSPSGPSGLHLRQAISDSVWWTLRHLTAGSLRRRLGSQRSLVASYEDMVSQPNRFLGEVARLVDEPAPPEDTVVDGMTAVPVAHTPTGSGRFGPGSVELVRDDRWKSALSPCDRLVVTALTMPLARRYGYRAADRRT